MSVAENYALVGHSPNPATFLPGGPSDVNSDLAPETLGFSDPPPLTTPQLGGARSSYWYNGRIYESDITRGLDVFRFSGRETGGALKLDHLNPQIQEFSLEEGTARSGMGAAGAAPHDRRDA